MRPSKVLDRVFPTLSLSCCSFGENSLGGVLPFSFSFLSIPSFFCWPFLFSFPPSRNSDPGSHSWLFSPFPTTVRALHFYREKISALPSSTRRVELCSPTLGALSS